MTIMPQPEDVRGALVRSSRESPDRTALTQRRNGANADLLPIMRGFYLPTGFLDSLEHNWQRRRAVEMARILALCTAHPDFVAAGRSAALILGFQVLDPLPAENAAPLSVISPSNWNPNAIKLPAVTYTDVELLPRTEVRPSSRTQSLGSVRQRHDISLQEAGALTVTAALLEPGRIAFALACEVFRQAAFNEGIRKPSTATRPQFAHSCVEVLDQLPPGTRSVRQARKLLLAADPGCESVGEAWLLWILKSAGFTKFQTQFRVEIEGQVFYLDLALVELRIAVEFDGRAKYGSSIAELQRAEEKERRRQRLLESHGWIVIRFRWTDLFQPEVIVEQIASFAEQRNRTFKVKRIHPTMPRQTDNHPFTDHVFDVGPLDESRARRRFSG